jgi:hypothetical protein
LEQRENIIFKFNMRGAVEKSMGVTQRTVSQTFDIYIADGDGQGGTSFPGRNLGLADGFSDYAITAKGGKRYFEPGKRAEIATSSEFQIMTDSHSGELQYVSRSILAMT